MSRERRSGHAAVRGAFAAALVGLVGVLLWLLAGDLLPGGRWFAVHLFTLGVLSPLVLALSQHFAGTLTHAGEPDVAPLTATFAGGAVAVLAGVAGGRAWLLAGGAVVVIATVALALLRLRRLRRGAVGARFGWVVRAYEHAHVAFLVGAGLGALLGVGALPGAWYAAGRVAHLHATVLGWGVVTLLATLVFFGPTVLRRQMEPGADERAARAVPAGAIGVAVAVTGLLASGAGGLAGTIARTVAAAGVVGLALAATVVCAPVVRVAVRGAPGAGRWQVVGACLWLVAALWADAVVVALGAWRWLDVLGAAVLVGALLQAIAAAVIQLAPIALARGRGHRDEMRRRLARHSIAQAVALDLGTVLVATAAALRLAGGPSPALTVTGRAGWGLVALAAVSLAGTVLAGAAHPGDGTTG